MYCSCRVPEIIVVAEINGLPAKAGGSFVMAVKRL